MVLGSQLPGPVTPGACRPLRSCGAALLACAPSFPQTIAWQRVSLKLRHCLTSLGGPGGSSGPAPRRSPPCSGEVDGLLPISLTYPSVGRIPAGRVAPFWATNGLLATRQTGTLGSTQHPPCV